jgi:hypothetical protein
MDDEEMAYEEEFDEALGQHERIGRRDAQSFQWVWDSEVEPPPMPRQGHHHRHGMPSPWPTFPGHRGDPFIGTYEFAVLLEDG